MPTWFTLTIQGHFAKTRRMPEFVGSGRYLTRNRRRAGVVGAAWASPPAVPACHPARHPPFGVSGGFRMTRSRRHFAALAAAGAIGAALAPGLAVAQAAAAPSPCAAPRFGAAAAADLVRVDTLDLHALGVNTGPVASVRVGSTAAGTTGGPSGRSAADARYLQAKILGGTVPAGPLDAKAHQEAPPAAEAGVTAGTPGVNTGVLAAGTGTLTAHTTWACTPPAGTAAESSAALLDAGVLPRDGHSLLRVPRNLASGASVGFVNQQGALRPQATATASLADVTIFEGTAGAVRVRGVSQPKLSVVAGGPR